MGEKMKGESQRFRTTTSWAHEDGLEWNVRCTPNLSQCRRDIKMCACKCEKMWRVRCAVHIHSTPHHRLGFQSTLRDGDPRTNIRTTRLSSGQLDRFFQLIWIEDTAYAPVFGGRRVRWNWLRKSNSVPNFGVTECVSAEICKFDWTPWSEDPQRIARKSAHHHGMTPFIITCLPDLEMVPQAHLSPTACHHCHYCQESRRYRGFSKVLSNRVSRNSSPEPPWSKTHEPFWERIDTDHVTDTQRETDCEHGAHKQKRIVDTVKRRYFDAVTFAVLGRRRKFSSDMWLRGRTHQPQGESHENICVRRANDNVGGTARTTMHGRQGQLKAKKKLSSKQKQHMQTSQQQPSRARTIKLVMTCRFLAENMSRKDACYVTAGLRWAMHPNKKHCGREKPQDPCRESQNARNLPQDSIAERKKCKLRSTDVVGRKCMCERTVQTIVSVSGDRRPQHFLGIVTRATVMRQVCSRARPSLPVASAVRTPRV